MKQEVFVLRMTGVQDQLIVAQSEEELAFRLYGNKIEHPTAQMFLDTSACISRVVSIGLPDKMVGGSLICNLVYDDDEWKTVQSYLDKASEIMAAKKYEVLPNE